MTQQKNQAIAGIGHIRTGKGGLERAGAIEGIQVNGIDSQKPKDEASIGGAGGFLRLAKVHPDEIRAVN